MAHFDPNAIFGTDTETNHPFMPPVLDEPETEEAPSPAPEFQEPEDTSPSARASSRTASPKGKRGRTPTRGKADVQKALHLRIPENEYTELKVACVYGRTTLNDFVRSAFMDSLKRTYECTDAGCGFRFTTRTTDGVEPPKAVMCPICGKKVSAVRY